MDTKKTGDVDIERRLEKKDFHKIAKMKKLSFKLFECNEPKITWKNNFKGVYFTKNEESHKKMLYKNHYCLQKNYTTLTLIGPPKRTTSQKLCKIIISRELKSRDFCLEKAPCKLTLPKEKKIMSSF